MKHRTLGLPTNLDPVVALPRWALRWIYWNGYVYKVAVLARFLQREYKYRKAHKNYGVTNPIVLFQMGKVGSTAISSTLSHYDFDVPVYTFHTLTDFDEMENFIKRTSVDPRHPLQILERSRRYQKQLFSGRWNRYNVITLVRSPIHRTVSAFFEHWSTSNPDFVARVAANTATVSELTDAFLHQFYHDTAEVWFDAQFRPVFGMDVYAEPFDVTRGYQIYDQDQARVLLLRYEDLPHTFTTAMREFLGVPNMQLQRHNVTENREYGNLYREFVQTARLPREYVDQMHSTCYARHFYSPQELEGFARFWLREE